MSATEVWRAGETRSVVWWLIHDAGKAGIGRTELTNKSGKSTTSVDWHLTNLARDKFIQRPEGSKAYRWVSGPNRPPIEGLVRDLAFELLEDCPSGVSEKLLCQTLACSWKELGEALVPAEREGRVERMVMPHAHGGGVGWCLPGMRAAEEPLALPMQTVRLPVMEIDIDRIHDVQRPENFHCELKDGRLRIEAGAAAMTLCEAHTDKLLAYLMAEVCR